MFTNLSSNFLSIYSPFEGLLPFLEKLKMKDNEPLIIDRDADATPRPFCCCLDVRVGTVLIGLFYLVRFFDDLFQLLISFEMIAARDV